ncbi:hypothetical protein DB347_11920 [Opitutaceae bacterium EW11]|nr:hypothetical protein DB347_11920 [Opitutaceae bacterium EW11]
MRDPARVFRTKLAVLVVSLAVVVAASLWIGLAAARDVRRTVDVLFDVELDAAGFARDFRSTLYGLQRALLQVGTVPAADSSAAIRRDRGALDERLKSRMAISTTEEKRGLLLELSSALRSYEAAIDELERSPGVLDAPLDRSTMARLDEGAVHLERIADDFATANDAHLRSLWNASLHAVRRLRNALFGCIGFIVVITAASGALVARDVVRPLRAQLVESKALSAQHEKLAALGTLAAGVAHEIRNPLTAIKARLYTLKRTAASDAAGEDVAAITREIDRLERIVRDVLSYARPSQPILTEIDLSQWAAAVARFVEPDLGSRGIQLQLQAPHPVSVRADADQLRQAVLNLIRNAQDAFDSRPGHIALEVRHEHGPLRGRPQEVAVLTVRDDGPGIRPELHSRLFDPFFTTKASGTGLGLSLVARIVDNHGGEIRFRSAPGAGTRFDIRLPLVSATSHA